MNLHSNITPLLGPSIPPPLASMRMFSLPPTHSKFNTLALTYTKNINYPSPLFQHTAHNSQILL